MGNIEKVVSDRHL